MTRTRVAWLAIVLIVAGTLIVQELAARLLFPLPEIVNFNRIAYASTANSAPKALRRAAFSTSSAPDGVTFVHRLNLYGFRDREWTERRGAARRIVFVGASNVEGYLCSQDGTFPVVVERTLRASGANVEVYNAGVSGAGLAAEFRVARDMTGLFRPDELVLVLGGRDMPHPPIDVARLLAEPLVPVRRSPWRPRVLEVVRTLLGGEPVATLWPARPFPFFPAVPHPNNPWTHRASELAPHVDADIAEAMKAGRFVPGAAGRADNVLAAMRKPPVFDGEFAALHRFVSAHGARLRIVYHPRKEQISDHYRQYLVRFSRPGPVPSMTGPQFQRNQLFLAALLKRDGIDFLDATEALRRAEAEGRRTHWNYDAHLSPHGHEMLGRLIADWVRPAIVQ